MCNSSMLLMGIDIRIEISLCSKIPYTHLSSQKHTGTWHTHTHMNPAYKHLSAPDFHEMKQNSVLKFVNYVAKYFRMLVGCCMCALQNERSSSKCNNIICLSCRLLQSLLHCTFIKLKQSTSSE